MDKYIWLAILLFIAIVFVPVLVTKLRPAKPRSYTGVRLNDLHPQEVSFRNEMQNLSLAGMLFTPQGGGPFPAVVFIHGSGTSIRDNRWYVTLVSHLQKNGVAVLLPDKRGSEKSGGNWRTSSLEDLATDTLAAVDFLKDRSSVNISHIGLVGMSQGGWIAPIVANRSSDIEFIVNVVGTSLTAHEQVAYEEVQNLREMGFLPGIADMISRLSLFVLMNFTQKDFWNAVGNFDPVPYWRKLGIPVLTLYGSEDTNVPSEASKRRFDSLGMENIDVRIYQGSGHALQDPPGKGNSIFRDEALLDITKFIESAVSSKN